MGYWGDPSMGCEPCDCFVDGSDSSVCDSTDGQCLCKPRYAGQKCNQCAEGYAQLELKCTACSCDEWGSIEPYSCDPENGQCRCKPGVQGVKCNECATGHFGLKAESDGCAGKWHHIGIYFFLFHNFFIFFFIFFFINVSQEEICFKKF